MDFRQAVLGRLAQQGQQQMPGMPQPQGNANDPRGLMGILGRGANVYNCGMPMAQSGGGAQFGRPSKGMPMQAPQGQQMPPGMDQYRAAIARRLGA